MQIRTQGRKTQCIRSTYDPQIKRSRQTVVATFDRYADKFPSAGLDALTEGELAELHAWFDAKKAQRAAEDARINLRIAPGWLNRIAGALADEQADSILSADHVAAIWDGIARLQAAMRKAGHPRPAKPVKSKQKKALPGQADLL